MLRSTICDAFSHKYWFNGQEKGSPGSDVLKEVLVCSKAWMNKMFFEVVRILVHGIYMGRGLGDGGCSVLKWSFPKRVYISVDPTTVGAPIQERS
jgi:hypothetical protein